MNFSLLAFFSANSEMPLKYSRTSVIGKVNFSSCNQRQISVLSANVSEVTKSVTAELAPKDPKGRKCRLQHDLILRVQAQLRWHALFRWPLVHSHTVMHKSSKRK
jgi:hypothetical protein